MEKREKNMKKSLKPAGNRLRVFALIAALLLLLACALACKEEELINTLVDVDTPTPAFIPTPVPTATPVPTDTPEPEQTPEFSEEPSEEPTEEPTEEPATELPVLTPTPEPEATATPVPSSATASMMFVGDLMCLSMQQRGALSQANSGLEYDFRPSFEYVRYILNKADCAVGNLETVLSPSSPYSTQLYQFENGMPNLNAPPLYLMGVKYAGFDALVMANNHCLDAGVLGIEETLTAVENYGFKHTGLFRSESEKRFVMLNVKGIKVALLSYSEFFNYRESLVADRPYMINKYSEEKVRRDVASAKAAGAELVVAYNHWGAENTHEPTWAVRQHAQQMANAGVDVILGSHSHTVQPSVWLTASDGRKVLCVYSMGNFISSMDGQMANDTFITEIRIKRENGRVKVAEEYYYPVKVFTSLEGKWFVGVPTKDIWMPYVQYELDQAHERIMRVIMSER